MKLQGILLTLLALSGTFPACQSTNAPGPATEQDSLKVLRIPPSVSVLATGSGEEVPPAPQDVGWYRWDNCEIRFAAPETIVSYSYKGLTRRVYRTVQDAPAATHVGVVRVYQPCECPHDARSYIVVEYKDGVKESFIVPELSCD